MSRKLTGAQHKRTEWLFDSPRRAWIRASASV